MKNFEHTNLKVAGGGGANSIHHMSKMIMTPKYMSEVTPEIGVTLQNKHSNEEEKKEGAKGSQSDIKKSPSHSKQHYIQRLSKDQVTKISKASIKTSSGYESLGLALQTERLGIPSKLLNPLELVS